VHIPCSVVTTKHGALHTQDTQRMPGMHDMQTFSSALPRHAYLSCQTPACQHAAQIKPHVKTADIQHISSAVTVRVPERRHAGLELQRLPDKEYQVLPRKSLAECLSWNNTQFASLSTRPHTAELAGLPQSTTQHESYSLLKASSHTSPAQWAGHPGTTPLQHCTSVQVCCTQCPWAT
jgi:hypothetical protein